MRTFLFFLLSFFLSAGNAFAQQEDTLYIDTLSRFETDTTAQRAEESDVDEATYNAPPDSTAVQQRAFGDESLESLKKDPELTYDQPPTVAESLWDRFWNWVSQTIDRILNKAVYTDWGRLIVYAIGVALLVVLIMMMLKVNAFRMLYSDHASQSYQVLDENIHEMDFDRLIQEAVDQNDFRRGIRLLFLYALKLLSDRHVIHWQAGKTNHEYVGEVDKAELRTGLNELSFYFDYAWYGNFGISQAMFQKVRDTFAEFKTRLD